MGLIPVSRKCTHQGVPSCADSSDLSIVRTCHADSCEWLTSMIQWEAHMAPLLPASLNGLVTGCVSGSVCGFTEGKWDSVLKVPFQDRCPAGIHLADVLPSLK